MTLRRSNGGLFDLAWPLLGLLLAAGCGPGPRPPSEEAALDSTPAAPPLQVCAEPELVAPDAESARDVIRAVHPAAGEPPRPAAESTQKEQENVLFNLPELSGAPLRSFTREARRVPNHYELARKGAAGAADEPVAPAQPPRDEPQSAGGAARRADPDPSIAGEPVPWSVPARREQPRWPPEPGSSWQTPGNVESDTVWWSAARQRSPGMDDVARLAEGHLRQGYGLADRGAWFSARAEFIQALRLIAQALDVQSATARHSQALALGMRALEEAEDFIPRGSTLEAELDVAGLVSAHRTPALKGMNAEGIAPLVALQHYYTFAHEQLSAATANEETGSMALYALGKVYSALATGDPAAVMSTEPKAMVFHQAALSANPRNYLAANELAVLLAGYGQYDQARWLLLESLSVSPEPAAWHNLAVVHQQLGEPELAELARQELWAASASPAASSHESAVRWVDPITFAASSRPSSDLQTPPPTGSQTPWGVVGAGQGAPPVARKGLAQWLPWSSRRQ